MRNDPSKQPRITLGRTFVLEFLTRLYIENDEVQGVPAINDMMTGSMVKLIVNKAIQRGWKPVGKFGSNDVLEISRTQYLNTNGNIEIGADEFTKRQWQMLEEWLEESRRHGCFRLTMYYSTAAKQYDYNNIYQTVDYILRDVRNLLRHYFK